MSKTVDERVVEMRFDNEQFEKNAGQSIKTLDELKNSLNFSGAAKSFENLDKASEKINFSVLASSVEAVKEKFSAFEVMAVTALANITNSAVNAGKQMLASLVISPRKEGFGEYELKMGSIQTMMMSTGESLETVNKYLEELNLYADKTIYSFSDMTSNIGKFTNAGVNLKDSVKAIQGISNVAAISGANANEASRAMYNFAQALSSGSVKLIDWKSIENANMATVDFKNELLATALELGTVTKQGNKYVSTTTNINGKTSDAFNATQGFNDSLSAQWMTTEVLVKTLNRYSDETTEIGKKAFAAAQDVKTFTQLMDTLKEAVGSGWATTWETIFGDFEESKKLWTSVSNSVGGFIDKVSKARNELLKGWKDLGGRDVFFTAVRNAFEGLKSVITPVKEAFQEFFPAITPEKLVALTTALKNLTEKLKLSDETALKIKNTIKGMLAALDILGNLVGAVFRSLKPLVSLLGNKSGGLLGGLLGITGSFGEWLTNLDQIIKKNDLFYNGIQISIKYIKLAIAQIKKFADVVREHLRLPEISGIGKSFETIFDTLKEKTSSFGKSTLSAVDNFSERLSEILNKDIETKGLDNVNKKLERTESFTSRVSNVLQAIKNAIVKAFDAIRNYLSHSKLFAFFSALFKFTLKVFSGIGSVIGKSLGSITEKLQNADFDTLLNLIKTLSVGGIALAISRFFGNLNGGVSALKDGLSGFKGVSKGITSILDGLGGCLEAYQTKLKAGIIMKIALSVAILAASVLVLSLIDSKKLDASLGAITVMFGELMGSMAMFTKMSGNVNKGSKAASMMLVMSVSVLILASACKKLSKIEPSALAASIAAITVLMFDLTKFAKKFNNNDKILKASIGLIAVAAAMKIMASACKTLAGLDWNGVAKGVSGLSVLMYVLADFTKKLSNNNKILKAGIGLIAVSAGIKILASACKTLAGLDWNGVAKGVSGLSILMYVLADFTKKLSNNNKILKAGVALIAVSASIKILVSACKGLAYLEWDELGKGVGGLTVLMYVLADFVKKVSGSKIFSTGIALIAVGTSLNIIVSACKTLSQFSWVELGKGLSGLTVILYELSEFTKKISGKKIFSASLSMIAIGAGMKILVSACKSLGDMDFKSLVKGLSGIMALLLEVALYAKMTSNAGNILLAGTALIAMGIGLRIFAAACNAFSTVSWKAIAKALITLAGAFLVMGGAAKIFGPALGKMLVMIGVGILAIGAGLVVVGGGLTLIGVGLVSISAGITALATAASLGATEIAAVLGAIITGIADMIPVIAKKIGEAIIEFIKYIGSCAGEIKNSVKEIVSMLITVFVECVPDLVDAFFKLILSVLDALVEYAPDIVGKLMEFLTLVLKEFAERLPELIGAAVDVLTAFFVGIFDAFNNMDSGVLSKALTGVGILASILTALAALGALAVPAMAGVLAVGALVGELAAVMAALGALEQIPGINWIIGEGGKLLEAVGGAIGSFVGGLVGGLLEGIASKLPDIGKSLSQFFTNAQPFLDGMATIDTSSFEGIKALAEAMLVLTASNLLDALTSWFTGEASLSAFGKELAKFGPGLSKYYDSVKNVKGDVIKASASAALSIAEFAKKLPRRGGVVQWFIGNTATLSDFAKELKDFGPEFAKYSKTVESVKPGVVKKTSEAASSIAEFAKKLPTHGGIIKDWFIGDATLTSFAKELKDFGPEFANYSKSVEGVKPEVVSATSNAALSLANLASNLPSHGGIIKDWFTGDATLSTFAKELKDFGPAIKDYSDSVIGLNPGMVVISANAAKSLAALSKELPPHGGIIKEWFTGDATLSTFAKELEDFGPAMKSYSDSVDGIDADSVKASAYAAEALASAAQKLPKHDGLVQKFTGDQSLSKFAAELKDLGPSLKDFADSIKGIDFSSANTAAYAVDILARAESKLPKKNGVAQVITGVQSYINFANELKPLGTAIKAYASEVKGIQYGDVEGATRAISILVSANGQLSNTGGWVQNIIGEKDFGEFAKGLESLGPSMKSYVENVDGITNDTVVASANVIKILASAATDINASGGLWQKVVGEKDIGTFASGLKALGTGVVDYVTVAGGLENLDAAEKVANIGKILGSIQESIPTTGGWRSTFVGDVDDLSDFADDVKDLGEALANFIGTVGAASWAWQDKFDPSVAAVEKLLDLAKGMMDIGDLDEAEDFVESMGYIAKDGLVAFMNSFTRDDPYTYGAMTKTLKRFITDFKEALYAAISEQSTNIKNISDTLHTYTLNAFYKNQYKEELETIGNNAVTYVRDGMMEKEIDLKTSALYLSKVIEANIEPNESTFKEMGRNVVVYYTSGIKEKKNELTYIADNIVSVWMLVPIRNSYNSFYNAGAYLMAGFISGISNATNGAAEASRKVANAAKTAAEKELDEHSPSKVGYRIGDYFGLAFVNAIESHQNGAYEAGGDMAYSAKSGLSNAIRNINDYISGNVDTDVTIRPVLDLSGVRRDTEDLNDIMSAKRSLSIAGQSGLEFNNTAMSRGELKTSNADVVGELVELRNEVSRLNGVVSNMRVVMDTGALVGSIASPMNGALGRIAKYERRGN